LPNRSLSLADIFALVLAVAGIAAVVVGVAMWSIPAGYVVAGVCGIAAAYLIRYMEVQE